VHELDERLRERGFGESERDDAIGTLVRTGLVNDVRYAESRARQLASRGAGDALIRHTLARAGVDATVASDALLTVPPEAERAHSVIERRGPGPRTARYLLGKGFSEEVVSGVFAPDGADELG
jgi:SOS response regulatory protein OraA/RecX